MQSGARAAGGRAVGSTHIVRPPALDLPLQGFFHHVGEFTEEGVVLAGLG